MVKNKKAVYRAGLIPYYLGDVNVYMMFMKPSDPAHGGPDFQIAKGHIDEGENAEQAAIREANEELGLFPGNIKHMELLGNFLGRTKIYVARIKDAKMFGDPGHETGETDWMTLEQFVESGRNLHVPIIKAAMRKIRKIENLPRK